jgi:hypothetical protein
MLRDRDEYWRLQCRSDVETQIQHPHIRLQKLNAELAWSGAAFRHLVCLHLYWLTSLLSF